MESCVKILVENNYQVGKGLTKMDFSKIKFKQDIQSDIGPSDHWTSVDHPIQIIIAKTHKKTFVIGLSVMGKLTWHGEETTLAKAKWFAERNFSIDRMATLFCSLQMHWRNNLV
jgi:hypothetical protein